MSRRLLPYLSIAALAGCFGGDSARPNSTPSFVISDGAHTQTYNNPSANPDFFFLPPLVPNPVGNPNYNAADFNGTLIPTVEVCALALGPSNTEADVTLTTPCAYHGYFTSFPAPVNNGLQQYQGAWTVPLSDTLFYRVTVKVGTIALGFMDVHTVSNPSLLHTVGDSAFVGQQDGSSLPIKFRIEIGALCTPAGTRPCNSSTLIDPNGGSVSISTDGGHSFSGVHVPGENSQGGGQHTLTLQTCADLNPRVIDLPTFGSCIHVSATPDYLSPLSSPATVEVCDVAGDIVSTGLTEAQEHRVTLHRLDGDTVRALPHVAGCTVVTSEKTPTLRGVLADLSHGKLGAAVGKLAAMAGPAPLNARRLDQGAGGQTEEFSDFQFALPCKWEIVAAGNSQTGAVSAQLPIPIEAKCTDVAGDSVANATANFATAAGSGSVSPATDTTGPDGKVKTFWTLGAPLGSQSMKVSGRGIAGTDFNGPRGGVALVDPFMAIQTPFDPGPNPIPLLPVLLDTGSVTFGANGIIPFGSGGYRYKVVASNSTSPVGWQFSTFNDTTAAFSNGTAPFASTGSPCNYTPGTAWTRNTDILVRKSFTLPPGLPRTVQVRVAVDRYAKQVYLNGYLLNPTSLSWNGCAVPGAASDFILTGTNLGVEGPNLLTIRGSARSQSAFLDVRVAVP